MAGFEQPPSNPQESKQNETELRAAFEEVRSKPYDWKPDFERDPEGAEAWMRSLELVLSEKERDPEIGRWFEAYQQHLREQDPRYDEGLARRNEEFLGWLHSDETTRP